MPPPRGHAVTPPGHPIVVRFPILRNGHPHSGASTLGWPHASSPRLRAEASAARDHPRPHCCCSGFHVPVVVPLRTGSSQSAAPSVGRLPEPPRFRGWRTRSGHRDHGLHRAADLRGRLRLPAHGRYPCPSRRVHAGAALSPAPRPPRAPSGQACHQSPQCRLSPDDLDRHADPPRTVAQPGVDGGEEGRRATILVHAARYPSRLVPRSLSHLWADPLRPRGGLPPSAALACARCRSPRGWCSDRCPLRRHRRSRGPGK